MLYLLRYFIIIVISEYKFDSYIWFLFRLDSEDFNGIFIRIAGNEEWLEWIVL